MKSRTWLIVLVAIGLLVVAAVWATEGDVVLRWDEPGFLQGYVVLPGDADYHPTYYVEVRRADTGEALAQQTIASNCQAIVAQGTPVLGEGECGDPVKGTWIPDEFPEVVLEEWLQICWHADGEPDVCGGPYVPHDCNLEEGVCNVAWDAENLDVVIPPGCVMALEACGTKRDGDWWLMRILSEGEWYDTCPPNLPTPTPYPTQAAQSPAATYTPEPIPTCRPTTYPDPLPTLTPLPTSTPYPTLTPYPAQPS